MGRRRLVALLCAGLGGCGGFQPIGHDDLALPPGSNLAGLPPADLSGTTADLAQQVGGGFGPGPWGALPSGYCCNSDHDCRGRSCVSGGVGNMCSDECDDDSGCNSAPGLTCVGVTQFDPGHCQPTAPSTACVPASQYHYGAKKLGDCCTPTHNGVSGEDCEGGRCDASGSDSNPYICTNACDQPADCPGNFDCISIGTVSVCIPSNDPYSCN